jgi:hypothetical protein
VYCIVLKEAMLETQELKQQIEVLRDTMEAMDMHISLENTAKIESDRKIIVMQIQDLHSEMNKPQTTSMRSRRKIKH